MATNSYPSSSNSSLSYDSQTQTDISDEFRLLIVQLSEELGDEKTTEKIRYLYERQLGPSATERNGMDVLAMLRKLNQKGIFTSLNVGPLEDLLDHCDRNNLIDDLLRPYCKKLASQLTQEDRLDEIGPKPKKRAKLQPDKIKEFEVSEIRNECSNASVHGVISRLSRVHSAKNNPATLYFEADVTDGKKTLRFVCFDVNLRSTMEELKKESKAVTIKDCCILQSTYAQTRGNFELINNPETKVVQNPEREYDIPSDHIRLFTHTPKLDQLSKLKEIPIGTRVTVSGKVVGETDPVQVTKNTGLKLTKQEFCLADHSMCITLVVWEDDIGKVVDRSSYQFIDVKRKEYDGKHFLSVTKDSDIIKIEDIGDNLSAETMPNTNQEIYGEISAVDSVKTYKECASESCAARVNPISDRKGKCTKCKRTVKLSLCEDGGYVDFTIKDKATKRDHDVTAFAEVIRQIISSDTLADLDIEDQLMDADPATFVVNHRHVVVAVKRT